MAEKQIKTPAKINLINIIINSKSNVYKILTFTINKWQIFQYLLTLRIKKYIQPINPSSKTNGNHSISINLLTKSLAFTKIYKYHI